MNAAILIGLAAAVLLIVFSRPRLAFACVSASGVLGACVAWSCGNLAAAVLPLLYAVMFAWLSFDMRDARAAAPEVER